MKITRTRLLTHLALFSAVSFVLYYFEFKIFMDLKLDFSDIPALLGSALFGPVFGGLVALIKNVMNVLFKGGDPIGSLVNFMYAVILIVPVALARKQTSFKKIVMYLVWLPIGAIIMHYLNLYVVFPIYYGSIKQGTEGVLWSIYFPFNLIKGAILLVVTYLITPKLKHIHEDIV